MADSTERLAMFGWELYISVDVMAMIYSNKQQRH